VLVSDFGHTASVKDLQILMQSRKDVKLILYSKFFTPYYDKCNALCFMYINSC